MELDEELDLQLSKEDIDVGEDHSGMNDDTEGEEGEDSTLELLVLEQASGARNNGGAATASWCCGAAGSSAGGSAFN